MGDLLGSLVQESQKADNIVSLGVGRYRVDDAILSATTYWKADLG